MARRELISLTDAEIEARFDDRCTVEDLIFTDETLDHWREARSGWVNPGKVIADTADTFDVIGAQALKGQPREHITVVDFGPCRAVLKL